VVTQLRLEFLKLVHSWSFPFSFLALTTFIALMLWGFHSYAVRKAGQQVTAQFRYTYESKSYFNGLTFALYSVVFSFSLLIPIFVAMIAGAQIAGERHAGTLRMICVRPVSRVSLFFAKFLVVAFYTYLLVAFFIGLNLLVGLCLVGWGDLNLYPGALNLVEEPGKLMRDEALWRFAYASLSGTWALLVIAAIAMLFSVLCENPTTATIATLALYLGSYIIGRVEFFEHLRPYFFTTDMDFWRDVFKPAIPWQGFLHYASVCGAYIFGTLLIEGSPPTLRRRVGPRLFPGRVLAEKFTFESEMFCALLPFTSEGRLFNRCEEPGRRTSFAEGDTIMSRTILAVLFLSLTMAACDSSVTDNNSNANSQAKTTPSTQTSPTPAPSTPEPSVSLQQQFKAGDKVKVVINGSSADATVVKVDEKLGKVAVKLEGQTEEKTVAISDVTKRALP